MSSSSSDEDASVPAERSRRLPDFLPPMPRREPWRHLPNIVQVEHKRDKKMAYKRARVYGSDSDSSDELDTDYLDDEPRRRAYAFQIARPEPEATEDEESSGESVVPPRLPDGMARRARTVADVCESRYTGSGQPDGVHGARVTVVEGGNGKVKPLFRWIHFPWNIMNFDDFSDEVSRTPGLTATELNTLADLLDEVRRKHTTPPRTKGSARPLKPCCIQMELPSDSRRKEETSTPRTATWICLPYLSLEPYVSADVISTEPLLRARYSKVGKDRDMQQAVCRLKQAPPGYCFHIAQLWCLVLDNSLLFTCHRSPETSLFGESIQRTLRPAQDTVGNKSSLRILVCFRGSVMWSLPVEECSTWLRFMSHFREAWPRRLVFFRHKRRITAGEWPKIWQAACRATVTLELRIGKAPIMPEKGVLIRPQEKDMTDEANPAEPPDQVPRSSPEPKAAPKAGTQKAGNRLHPAPTPTFAIFTFLDGVPTTESAANSSALANHLAAVHEYLLHNTTFADRKRYNSCPEESRMSFYQRLKARGLEVSSSPDGVAKHPYIDDQIDLFNMADIIFSFFLPQSTGIPTASKFWGALGKYMEARPGEKEYNARTNLHTIEYRLGSLRSTLKPLAITITSFADIFRCATEADRSRVRVPDEVMQAWIHILMSLLYFCTDWEKAEGLLEDAKSLLDDGLKDMVMAMSDRTLLGQAVIPPMELVSLMSAQLIQNATPGLPTATHTYFSYISTINAEIDSRPVDRSRERHIYFLRQEVSLVQWILSAQTSIFETLLWASRATPHRPRARAHQRSQVVHRSTNRGVYVQGARRSRASSPASMADEDLGSGKLNLTGVGAGGFRELLLCECLGELSTTKSLFDEIMSLADDLKQYNRNKVETTKDRQERAIYAFTIVTVIFLPLSAVSSIFGMNTVDIRDMELGQWAYWAAAIPVTVGVIFLGLFFTGELRNLAIWALGPRLDGAMGYGSGRLHDWKAEDGFQDRGLEELRSKRMGRHGAEVEVDSDL